MTRQRIPHRLAVVLGCAGIVLLSLAAAFLSLSHGIQMQEMREQAAQTRARLMAQSISQSLSGAVSAGIPLHQLVGVAQFLERWQKNHPEVVHIAVDDPQGKTLWDSPGNAAGHAFGDTALPTGHADVTLQGSVLAKVSLRLRNDTIAHSRRAVGLLVPAVLLVSALAYLAAHFTCAQGPWLRNHGFRMSARWVARGDYRRLLMLPQHKDFDLRVQEVTHAMRGVHERMARMRQLIGSLRRTEPQQLRRDYLDQILKKAEGSDHFTLSDLALTRLVAVQSQSMWMAVLLSLAAVSPLTFSWLVFQNAATTAAHWHAALPAATLALLLLSAAAGWRIFPHLRMSTLSVLILSSVAMLLPLLALLADVTLHPGWMAAWNGGFAGAAIAACTRAQTLPDHHPGYAHASPHLPGAALLAWWGGLLWLAPALGFYAYEALPNAVAEVALLLPVACVLFFATRWDVAHSAWRVRMVKPRLAPSPPPLPGRAHPPLRWTALGVAAGLLASHVPLAFDAVPLLQQGALGVGVGAGIAAARGRTRPGAPRQRALTRWQLIALAAALTQLATGLGGSFPAWLPQPWLDLAQPLSHLLLGLLLGRGLAQATRQPQDAITVRLLLCATLGAALCAAAFLLGLPAWPAFVAALLLTQSPRTKARHAD